jgi:hypothetical protein
LSTILAGIRILALLRKKSYEGRAQRPLLCPYILKNLDNPQISPLFRRGDSPWSPHNYGNGDRRKFYGPVSSRNRSKPACTGFVPFINAVTDRLKANKNRCQTNPIRCEAFRYRFGAISIRCGANSIRCETISIRCGANSI